MRVRIRHIVVLLIALALFASCKGPKRISRKELTDIVYEMLIRDQQLKIDRRASAIPDSVLVYEGIFKAHGYNTDDYIYSVEYYLRDPDRFSKVFRDVAARLEKEKARVDREIELRDWRLGHSNAYHIPVDSLFEMLYPDSLHLGNVRAVQHPVTLETRFMAEGDDSLFLATDFSPLIIMLKEKGLLKDE